MSDKRIIDLEAKQTLGSGDYLAADSAQGTYKVDANTNIMTPLANVRNNVANSSASPDKYSSSTAYKVGDMVIQNDILYKCTTACSAASWAVNSACFTATTLASVVTQLNSDLNTLQNRHILVAFSPGAFRNKTNESRYIKVNTEVAGTVKYKLDDTLMTTSFAVGWNVIEVPSGKTFVLSQGFAVDQWYGFIDLRYFEQIS
jgi:hypothetical protein